MPDNIMPKPPDQMGYEGVPNPRTGWMRYTTPQGTFEMDPSGNWTDLFGQAVNFDQGPNDAQKSAMSGGFTGAGPGGPDSNAGGGGNGNMPGTPVPYHLNTIMPGTPVPYHLNTITGPEGGGPVGGGAGGGGGPANVPPAFKYLSGVTSANPMGGSNAVNSTQFADPASAQALATQLGGQAYGLNLQGPGMGFSQPMQQIKFGNGQEINAGLANDLYGKYGSAPGTYGNYLVNRDVTGDYGPSPYDTQQNASGAAAMAQAGQFQQQMGQYGQQQYNQYQQQMQGQQQAEQQQAVQALMANGWASQDGSTWINTRTGESQMADPVRLLMREMPGLQAPSQSWEPPSLVTPNQNQPQFQQQQQQQPQQQPQQNYGGYGQQPQQYQAQPYPMPNQSATQVGAQSYQGMQSPQAYQNQHAQSGSFAQQPGYGQYGGQQPQQGQQQQPQARYGSYGGSMGGNTRQPSQQSQQPSYTAGQSSTGYKSPYGGGYLSSGGTPSQSKSGGYMQTGNNKF